MSDSTDKALILSGQKGERVSTKIKPMEPLMRVLKSISMTLRISSGDLTISKTDEEISVSLKNQK